jgi:short subunit dehydrogenase-like uncharacterized protein
MTDIVVFGATSFVGRIVCRYLAERYGGDGELEWAMAARSRERLEDLRASLGPGAAHVPLLTADAADERALERLCESAKLIASTVGPYALHGGPLVRVCARTGTDYCDLAGEIPWIRAMIAEHAATAVSTGARLVHCCGFDSIPFDLGVRFLQSHAVERYGRPCNRIKMRVKGARGQLSGGTVASLLNVLKLSKADPAIRRTLASHYALVAHDPADTRQHEVRFAEYDTDFAAWAAPFLMAIVNTRVVHRSNALRDYAYGRDFQYDEAMLTGPGLKGRAAAYALATGLAGFMAAASIDPTRRLLERFVLPAPGEGPSEESQRNGYYDLRFLGQTPDGSRVLCKVTGDRDPGYGSTARIFAEAAASLAKDVAREERGGGSWMPAAIFDERLISRLEQHAGLRFERIER